MGINGFPNGKVVESEVIGNFLVITPVTHEITYKNSKDLLHEIKDSVDQHGLDVILNMEKVVLIDSVSLGTLVAIKKYVKAHNKDVYIASLSALILELFHLLNFPAVFEIYDNVDAALAGK